MSILQRLKRLYCHCCENCKYFEPYGEINYGEVDCALDDGRTLKKQYYWSHDNENDCEFFDEMSINKKRHWMFKEGS